MKTVSEVMRLTGVSVRTLHHYDAIGLLKPTKITESGYRLYDEAALMRLQTILLFRELQFPLKEIREILSRPSFDPMTAIAQQIELLSLKRDRLDSIISLATHIQKTGVIPMDFSAYDSSKIDRYTEQAQAKWGHTDAWKEYQQKTKGKSAAQMRDQGEALMDVFREIGAIRHLPCECDEAQALIEKLRACITENFYTCTADILKGLGQMYAAGGEMTENIDRAGGKGTAEFSHRAIEAYLRAH